MSASDSDFIPPPPKPGRGRQVAPPPTFQAPPPISAPPMGGPGTTADIESDDVDETIDAETWREMQRAAATEPEPDSDPQSELKAEPEPNPEPEPDPDPGPELDPRPEPASEPEPELDPEPEHVQEPSTVLSSNREGEIQSTPSADVPADGTGRPRRRLPRTLVIAGAAVVAVAGGGFAGYSAIASSYSPQRAAEQFLAEIVEGDAETIIERFDLADDESALITDDIIAGLGSRIESYEIGEVATDGSNATVEVILHADSGDKKYSLDLVARGTLLAFNVWTVQNPLGTVQLTYSGPPDVPLTVNNVELDVMDNVIIESYVLPGEYEVAVSRQPLLTEERVDLAMGFGGSNGFAYTATLNDDGVLAARAAVDAFLDDCIASTTPTPSAQCYFGSFDDPTVHSVVWSFSTRPVIEPGPWIGTGWDVTAATPGLLAFHAEGSDEFGAFSFGGEVGDYYLFGVLALVSDSEVAFVPY